jgi:hypothetical protein
VSGSGGMLCRKLYVGRLVGGEGLRGEWRVELKRVIARIEGRCMLALDCQLYIVNSKHETHSLRVKYSQDS